MAPNDIARGPSGNAEDVAKLKSAFESGAHQDEQGEEQFQNEFYKIWRDRIPAAQIPYAKGEISKDVADLATELNAIDQWSHTNVSKAQIAVEEIPETWTPGRYGVGRRWGRDTRVVLKIDSGEIVGLAGGPNRPAAQKSAKQLARDSVRLQGKQGV
jgi:hypothetical protein